MAHPIIYGYNVFATDRILKYALYNKTEKTAVFRYRPRNVFATSETG
jgi:hypothetical protein